MARRRFELVEGSTSKFWEVEVDGASFTVTFGRIGTDGQSKQKKCKDAAAAKTEADKLVAEKLKKGYSAAAKAAGKARPDKARPDKARPDKARPDKARPDKARPADRQGPDEFGNRSPAPFPPIATGDTKLDGLLRELVELAYGDKTDPRRAALRKSIGARLRKPQAGDAQALLALLVDPAFDLGELQDTDEGRGTPAVKRERKRSWDRVFGERYARGGTLQLLLQAALQHPECDARLAELAASPSLETVELVAEAIEEADGEITVGPKLITALGKRAGRCGEGSSEGIAHEAVVKALLRAPVAAAFDALAPIVSKWSGAGEQVIGVLAQDVEEMASIPLDERWRGVLHGMLAKHPYEALRVLKKMPPRPEDVPAILSSIERELAKIKPGQGGDPPVDEEALVLLARSGDKRALPALLKVTECSDFGWVLRDLLFESIAELGDESAVEPLARFVARNQEDGDEELVKAARSAMKKLSRGKPLPPVAPPTTKSAPTKAQPYAKAGPALTVPKTSAAEERVKIERRIDEARLPAALVDQVKGALRGAIRLYSKRVAEDSLPIGTSRFGGRPDLPAGTPWPRTAKIPMTFIAQLRLEELAPFDVDGLLPKRGLLSFFLHDEATDSSLEMYSAHQVLFFPDADGLERAALPDGFTVDLPRKPLATAALRFHTGFELPSAGTREAKALGKEAESLELPGSLELPRPATLSQVLGHDDYRGNDEIPAKGTRPLLRCDSDRQADMNFGDAADIAFRIKDEDLAAARFDRVKLWFQTG